MYLHKIFYVFCDREKETDKIINSIRNQQDITLFAIRRTGKSALINHIFNHLEESYDCLYVDLWGTTSLSGFINEAANAGKPSVDIIYHDRNQVFNRLEEIFQFLTQKPGSKIS